jgi:predicted O-linked N-acetylglucosamine transferase (SPINDLY family)
MHHEVDMLLDCFPFAGLTVTALAAWMGVPTITIAGHNSSARGGASIMHSLDLDSFVASDPADFVNKAVALSTNLPMLAAVRASMRERMAVQYTNGEAYTRAFEAELRKTWQQWCDTQN